MLFLTIFVAVFLAVSLANSDGTWIIGGLKVWFYFSSSERAKRDSLKNIRRSCGNHNFCSFQDGTYCMICGMNKDTGHFRV